MNKEVNLTRQATLNAEDTKEINQVQKEMVTTSILTNFSGEVFEPVSL